MTGRTLRMTVSDRWFSRLVVLGVVLGFLAVIGTGLAATLVIVRNGRHTVWVNHTYQVERQVSQFRVLLERAEAARRGLLLSDDPHIQQNFRRSYADLPGALDNVRQLTRDNPRQQANVAAVRPLLLADMDWMWTSYMLVRNGRRDQAVEIFRATRSAGLVRGIRARAEAMMAEEDRLLAVRNRAQRESLTLFFVILTIAGVLLAMLAISSVWVILRYTHDLSRSRDLLQGLNANLEGAVRERTVDLQRANDEIQRFAYIVSHDLRSPLVNVMGFTAELETATKVLGRLIDRADEEAPALVTADARLAAREDLPEAIGFIRTSTQKMDRLINAILRLSREGRRPITPEPIDMDAMAKGIADSLKHRTEELGAGIGVAGRLPAITSDRLAIEQIFSNIIENALKYLQPGRPGRIELAGKVEGGRAIFTVADNGRGIDPRDHERIFDLFRRSGQQDQPGEGIGLAHTRALAYRLGGQIEVRSELGEGATFIIHLPLTFSGEQGTLT